MAAASIRVQKWLLGWSLFQIGVVALTLDTPSLFYDPLYLWPRIATPALLLAGLVGALMGQKWMLYAGWAGVGLFLAIVCATAIPGEDYISSGANAPNLISGKYALGKFSLLLGAGISLVVCFGMLAKTLKTQQT